MAATVSIAERTARMALVPGIAPPSTAAGRTRGPARHLNLPIPPPSVADFYQELGCPFIDSKTDEPVRTLAPYQHRTLANHEKYRKLLVLKSQKIGLSSLGIIMTLHHALTDCQGFQIIILAQSIEKSEEHADDLVKILKASPKYRDYLIGKPTDNQSRMGTKRDKTRVQQVMIQTRNKRRQATRIYVLPPTAPAIASLKRVKYIWASDITIIRDLPERQKLYFQALTSRLILTEGKIFIECPTVGHLGPIYDLDEKFQALRKAGRLPGEHEFYVDRIKVQEAVDAGLMTQAAVDSERAEHGPMFDSFFNADWFAGDSVWYKKDQLSRTTSWATSLVEDTILPSDLQALREIVERQSSPMYGVQTPLPPLQDVQVPDYAGRFADVAWFAGLDPAVKVDRYGVVIHGLFSRPDQPSVPWTPFIRDAYNIRHESMTDVNDWLVNVLFRAYPPRAIVVDATRDTPTAEEIVARYGESRTEQLFVSNKINYELKQNAYAYLSEKAQGGYAFPSTERMHDRRKAIAIADLKLQSLHERVEFSPTGAPTFMHPRGRHNDLNRAWEMSLRGVRKFQSGMLAHVLDDPGTRKFGSPRERVFGSDDEHATRLVMYADGTTAEEAAPSLTGSVQSIYPEDGGPQSSSDARTIYT